MRTAPDLLVDTSAAVALVLTDHEAHRAVWTVLHDRELGLAGHAWFETYSVLTRLPGASRRDATTITRLLEANFPKSCFLPAHAHAPLAADLAACGVSGGAVYDALVAATAAHHGLPLASRDRRAADTYRSFGVGVELLS